MAHLLRIVILSRLNTVSIQEGTPLHKQDCLQSCAGGTLSMEQGIDESKNEQKEETFGQLTS